MADVFQGDTWKYGLLVVGILFIIAAMFSLGRGRSKQSAGQHTARDHVERARQKQGVRDELEALMVDINRMARDMGGQLDAKLIRIEQATREADERIAELQRLSSAAQVPEVQAAAMIAQPDTSQAADEPTLQEPANQADPLTREVYALADRGIGAGDIAEQLGEHVGKVELILALRAG